MNEHNQVEIIIDERYSFEVDEGLGFERETLYTYLQENAKINISFDEEVIMDPNNENTVIGTGV